MSYGRAKAAFIGWTMGVNHSTQGSVTVAAINNLALLTGNIGRSGAAPFSITGQCNAMGTRESGFASSMPGYRKFDCDADRSRASRAMEHRRRPSAERTRSRLSGHHRSCRHRPRQSALVHRDQSCGLVSQLRIARAGPQYCRVSSWYRTASSHPHRDFADLVLPAAIWGEKEGTYTNSERRVSKVNAFAAPPGEARRDFDIFLDLAARLGVKDATLSWLDLDLRCVARVAARFRRAPLRLQQLYLAAARRRRRRAMGRRKPLPRRQFQTESGRAKLHCVPCLPFQEQPNRDYDLVLNTGRTVEHWHTRTKTGAVAHTQCHGAPRVAGDEPLDAERRSLRQHDRVTVASRRSAVANVELRITGIVAPGQVFMPFHFAEQNSNLCTLGAYDPISREPNFKQCAVRVERTAGHR